MLRTLPFLLLAGCTTVNLPPSQKQQQEQTQSSTLTVTPTQTVTPSQDTQHASDSRQGTVSQPIIVICNQLSSSHSRCVTPKEGDPFLKPVDAQKGR